MRNEYMAIFDLACAVSRASEHNIWTWPWEVHMQDGRNPWTCRQLKDAIRWERV